MNVRPWVVVALWSTGCTWLGRNQLDERLEGIDQDGDGVSIAGGDCAPTDPDRSPSLDEVPYDRVDNDCDELATDVVDVDQDGYAGISQEDYEALPGDLSYPASYVGKALDCDDDDQDVFPDPDHSIELYKDGIDGDCQRDNDYDEDGDGYHPDTLPEGDVATLLATYIAENGLEDASGSWGPGGVGPALGGDCDDTQPDVNPGAAVDGWYDGVDDNCDDVNDFDQDGDGFMPAEWVDEYEFYVNRYYGDDPPPFVVDPDPFRDCADAARPPLLTVEQAGQVYPGAPETWYDGIDGDCGQDNDFDRDGDTWMPDGVVAGELTLDAMRDYAATWGYEALVDEWAGGGNGAVPEAGDCDDEDPTTHPGALESIDDTADQDCNGNADLAEWGFDGERDFLWDNPTNPELVRLHDEYLLLVAAKIVNLSGKEVTNEGVTLRFPLDQALGGAPPQFPYTSGVWKGGFQVLAVKNRLDIALSPVEQDFDGDALDDRQVWTVVGASGNSQYSYVYVGAVKYNTASRTLTPSNTYDQIDGPVPALYTYVAGGLDLTVDDDGDPFAAACGTRNLSGASAAVVHALWSDTFPAPADYLQVGGDTCWFTGAPERVGPTTSVPMEVCALGDDCGTVVMENGPNLSAGPTTGEQWLYGDNDEGAIVLLDTNRNAWLRDATGSVADAPIFRAAGLPSTRVKVPTSSTGATIDAMVVDGTSIVAAAILENNEVWLQYGSPVSPQILDLDFVPPAGTGLPTGVSVYADADRIAVAVSTTEGDGTGSVGWMFLGPP